LPAPLHAVAEDSDGFAAEDGLDAFGRKVGTFDDVLGTVADLDLALDGEPLNGVAMLVRGNCREAAH
jgi:hypothetical protein